MRPRPLDRAELAPGVLVSRTALALVVAALGGCSRGVVVVRERVVTAAPPRQHDAGTSHAAAGGSHMVNSTTADAGPPLRPAPTIRAIDVALGGSEGCARLADQTVRCWGTGALRIEGVPDVRSTPVVAPALAGFEQLAFGSGLDASLAYGFGCGLRAGEVFCWGDNREGQLGDATTVRERRDVGPPVRGLSGVRSIALGRALACAVRSDGHVWCWGTNAHGELADGTTTRRNVPVELPGLAEIDSVSLDGYRGCAVTRAGAVLCWGDNDQRRTAVDDERPTVAPQPVELRGRASRVAVGAQHTCALRVDGTVVCWGNHLPITQIRAVADAVDVRTTGFHDFYAVGRDGRVRRWSMTAGLDRSVTAGYTQPEVAEGFERVAQLRAASNGRSTFVCALRADGELACRGDNREAQLAQGSVPIDRAEPVAVAGLTDATQLSSQHSNMCAVRANGRVVCWGATAWRDTSDVDIVRASVREQAGVTDAEQVVQTQSSACARRRSGAVTCWGINTNGILGTRPRTGEYARVDIASLQDAVQLEAGEDHVCARRRGGTLSCWGALSSFAPRLSPVTPIESNDTVAFEPLEIAGVTRAEVLIAGGSQTCVRTAGASAAVCGGDWELLSRLAPPTALSARAVSSISRASAVALGTSCNCAVAPSRSVECWCASRGNPIGAYGSTPRTVAGVRGAVSVASGTSHACAVDTSGAVWCWGSNDRSQLGSPASAGPRASLGAARVALDEPAAEVAVGNAFTCARLRSGGVKCWGADDDGQLGDGAILYSSTLIPMRWP